MELAAYCKSYFAATGVHIALLNHNRPIYSSLGEMLSLNSQIHWDLFKPEHNPYFCNIPPNILYGAVHVEGTDNNVILGPIFNIPANEELCSQLTNYLGIPAELTSLMQEILRNMPPMNSMQLTRHLALIHLTLNGQQVAYDKIYNASDIVLPETKEASAQAKQLEQGDLHNSYYFELELYQKVREGSREQLSRFFQENTHISLKEGLMAHDPLRHAKNVFIATIARTGFIGAIPGGLNVEKTYQLMDYYIRECEQLTTVEEVSNLQYAVVMDFCGRTGEAKRPENISSDVWHCMNYIRSHIYDAISLPDVAACVHRSVSYVSKLFSKELGVHVSAYITRCKLEEAQTLLIYTEKSLSRISSDLCFSSQSYFQNLFKEAFQVTPAQFRRQARTI